MPANKQGQKAQRSKATEKNIFSERYFSCEAMVTAGPRKGYNLHPEESDFGLGEDVAGFITKKKKTYFWILDGTSDSDKLQHKSQGQEESYEDYFSSRLLAQSIGWNILKLIEDSSENTGASTLLQRAINITETHWRHTLEHLNMPTKEKLLSHIKIKGAMQCSATVALGILTIKGKLDACQIGDVRLLTYPTKEHTTENKGRQFVFLKQINDEIVIEFNQLNDFRKTTIQLDNITMVIAMTDGISKNMQNWLEARQNIVFSDPDTRKILTEFKHKTCDDKAICVIQIKG